MNIDERDLFRVPDDATRPEREPRKCKAHDWQVAVFEDGERITECRRCGKAKDEARAKTGRNNRKRGGAAELVVARKLSGDKVGPLGLPWDVAVPGFLRAQVKKLARWPSLAAVIGWLDAIPAEPELRAVVVTGTGRGARSLIVMDLDEFADWFGQVKGDAA